VTAFSLAIRVEGTNRDNLRARHAFQTNCHFKMASETEDDMSREDTEQRDLSGFLDDEASEAGLCDDSIESSEVDYGRLRRRNRTWHDGRGQSTYLDSFPQFVQLPIELRQKVWEFFCPDLVARARVFEYQRAFFAHLQAAEQVSEQTMPARAVLLVHRESRHLALKSFPDKLETGADHGGLLPLNLQTDIVALDLGYEPGRGPAWRRCELRILRKAHNLGLRFLDREAFFEDWREKFFDLPSLRRIYLCFGSIFYDGPMGAWSTGPARLLWCVDHVTNQYYVSTHQLEEGFGEDYEQVYCFPDVKHGQYAREHVFFPKLDKFGPLLSSNNGDDLVREVAEIRRFGAPKSGRPDSDQEEEAATAAPEDRNGQAGEFKYEVWPMVRFTTSSGKEKWLWEQLKTWDGTSEGWTEDYETEDSRGSSDEYESEGIDDDDVDENPSSEDGDDVVVLSDDDEEEEIRLEAGHDHSDVVVSGLASSPNGAIDIQSSQSDPAGSDEHEAEAQDEDARPIRKRSRPQQPERSRKRQILASDSDNGSGSDDVRVSGRSRQRGGPVIISDDEEEEEDANEAPRPAPYFVVSRRDKSTRAVTDSSSEEEDDESQSEAGEDARPMSLMETLRMGREQNPIPVGDSDDGSGDDPSDDSGGEADEGVELPPAQWSEGESESETASADSLAGVYEVEGSIEEEEDEDDEAPGDSDD
jgi:hypothetical protein